MAMSAGIQGLLRRTGHAVLDAVLPARCFGCGTGVDRQGALCPSCWALLTFIGPPFCAICGQPFEHDLGAEALCGACFSRPPAFDRARAVLRYDDASRPLILKFKHGDRTEAAPAFGRWLARAGAELLDQADLLAPVPLHWTRLFGRRFNQAALLAQALKRVRSITVVPDLLVRRQRTPSQGGLRRTQRTLNVRGAFMPHPRHTALITGSRIVLVDDVVTTGATVEACARVLRRAGAKSVDVLALARVTRARG